MVVITTVGITPIAAVSQFATWLSGLVRDVGADTKLDSDEDVGTDSWGVGADSKLDSDEKVRIDNWFVTGTGPTLDSGKDFGTSTDLWSVMKTSSTLNSDKNVSTNDWDKEKDKKDESEDDDFDDEEEVVSTIIDAAAPVAPITTKFST